MNIKPIKRVKVGEQVFQQLKAILINGEWRPGDKVPSENELAEQFDVSRITVRQALQRLGALGLIETRRGEGSFVKEINVGNSMNALIPTIYLGENTELEIIEFRAIIETECAALAAERANEKDIEDLQVIWDRMNECKVNSDSKGFGEADLDFHFKIAEITKNPLIIKTNLILRDVLEHAMRTTIDKMGFEGGLYYHKKLIEEIGAHDAKAASKTMREHIKKNKLYT